MVRGRWVQRAAASSVRCCGFEVLRVCGAAELVVLGLPWVSLVLEVFMNALGALSVVRQRCVGCVV